MKQIVSDRAKKLTNISLQAMKHENDEVWMAKTLQAAERGRGSVSPNPMVGAVIVKAGKQIAVGHHAFYGGPHAEVQALAKAGPRARGATLYVNLEPCSTWGKTPPCTEALIRSGIKKIVIAMVDPNPANHKKGITFLRKRGISVTEGVLKEAAASLNQGFFTLISKKRPFVTLKMAQSLDGKIATFTGESRWITSPTAREYVQELRARHDAVLVGFNTAFLDNPSLTVRSENKAAVRPWRVILDPDARIKSSAKVFRGAPVTIRVVSRNTAERKAKAGNHKQKSEIILPCEISPDGKIDLKDLLRRLGECGVTSLLVEGGGETAWSFIRAGLVDRVLLFLAPKIIGGRDAKTSVEGDGVRSLEKAYKLRNMHVIPVGDDLLIEGEL